MTYNIFLDDERIPEQVYWVDLPDVQWTIVRNMLEFVEHIEQHGLPQIISFDNDLGFDELEGRDCAKWLVEQIMDGKVTIPDDFQFFVHSKNCIAAQWIDQYLKSFFQAYKVA